VPRKTIIPFAIFIAVVAFLAIGLNRDPGEVPSPFIDKPAPGFTLPVLDDSILANSTLPSTGTTISNKDMAGKVWLFNVWASWCVACRDEHPLLIQLSQKNIVDIVGLNYKDVDTDARIWLKQFGNPYSVIAVDEMGNIGIEYGVYGVPETFVIDKKGVVRLKHIGPLTTADVENKILPLISSLQQEASS
jgi:cytochrome c biogenesis protein CcmG/thiol:disulfide interchange protein DsbE